MAEPDVNLSELRLSLVAWGDAVQAQTEREAADILAIWTDGLDQFVGAVETLRDKPYQRPGEDQEPALFAELAHAMQLETAGYRLALAGHYAPALALVRLCVEHLLAWWFIWNRPAEAGRFMRRSAKPTPQWNELEQAHEAALGGNDAELRSWRNFLNKLSHVDRQTADYVWTEVGTPQELLRFAPEFDRGLLIATTGLFCQVLPFLLECAELLRRRYGVAPPDPDRAAAYRARLRTWIAALPAEK